MDIKTVMTAPSLIRFMPDSQSPVDLTFLHFHIIIEL